MNRTVDKRMATRRKIFFPQCGLSIRHTQRVNTVTRSSGDWPSWLRSVGSAPCARSSAHNWVLPFCAASCKGVNAHLSVALTHALYLMSKAVTSTCCNETHGAVVLSGWCLFHLLTKVAAWIWLCLAAKWHRTLLPSPTGYYEIWEGEHNTCTAKIKPEKKKNCRSKPAWLTILWCQIWNCWSTNEEDCLWNFHLLLTHNFLRS